MCPEPEPSRAEDPVTDRELADGRSDGFDLSRKFGAEDALPRPADSKDEAADELDENAATPVGLARMTVQPIDRRRVDPDQHLIRRGDRPLDLFESKNLGRPIAAVHNGSHSGELERRVLVGN